MRPAKARLAKAEKKCRSLWKSIVKFLSVCLSQEVSWFFAALLYCSFCTRRCRLVKFTRIGLQHPVQQQAQKQYGNFRKNRNDFIPDCLCAKFQVVLRSGKPQEKVEIWFSLSCLFPSCRPTNRYELEIPNRATRTKIKKKPVVLPFSCSKQTVFIVCFLGCIKSFFYISFFCQINLELWLDVLNSISFPPSVLACAVKRPPPVGRELLAARAIADVEKPVKYNVDAPATSAKIKFY